CAIYNINYRNSLDVW
nr:immunoglobulin heavy chain junction region [Macaca mulatta]